jgi:hypothetical protein
MNPVRNAAGDPPTPAGRTAGDYTRQGQLNGR